jgi:low affinity Fe/Cu permease
MTLILYLLYYVVAISALVLHFTGHLERWGMQWLLVLLAVTVFPVVMYL